MNYAPVIITTLNRKEHLQRCLESLDRNTGAEKTDVHISVDYPPLEKYQKGYEEVCNYLKTAKFRFKNTHIYFQEKNIGPSQNCAFLRSQVAKNSDVFILTEDDNEFSENFLEYINKGLEKYKDDAEILAICGYKDTQWEYGENNIAKVKLFAAYGYGTWFKKDAVLRGKGKEVLFAKRNTSLKGVYCLYKKNKSLFVQYVSKVLCDDTGIFWNKDGELVWSDSLKSMYMAFSDGVVIVPREAKSRTWGNDGSGLNMPLIEGVNPELDTVLDDSKEFEFEVKEKLEFYEVNHKHGDKYLESTISKVDIMLSWIKYIIFRLCGSNRKKTVPVIKKITKVLKKER